MHVFSTPSAVSLESSCITIGNFDGVHRGHKSLLFRTLERANEHNSTPVVVTFWPHPRCVVAPNKTHNPLSTREERILRLSELGIHYVLELPFTRELAGLSPEAFVRDYLLPLHLHHLITGYDFTLGRARSGHTKELRAIGEREHFTVEQMPALEENGLVISSTRLRNLLTEGKIDEANRLLGRPYSLTGQVIHGEKRGRVLGYPTANMEPPAVLLPADGVYVAKAQLSCEGQKQTYDALVNIGTNPTFDGKKISIESFLLNFQGDCYAQTLTLFFLCRLRGEERFANADALKAQLAQDQAKALDFLRTHKTTF